MRVFICMVSMVILGTVGCCASRRPDIVIHQYRYQPEPPAVSPGTYPNVPDSSHLPARIDYPIFYRSGFDDPTLVVFKSDTYRRVEIHVDGEEKQIRLGSYGASADLHFSPGRHRIRIVIFKPTTGFGTLEVVRFFTVWIRPEGRSQILYIYDYDY